MSHPLAWKGLDFDTAEMDGEITALLSQIAPEGGSLRTLTITARVRAAHAAAGADANLLRVRRAEALGADLEDSTPQEQAMGQMATCLDWLAAAQHALFEAHEVLRGAQRAVGSIR